MSRFKKLLTKMPRISIELVPRTQESFAKELMQVKENFPAVETINIPDILRYEIRSLEGAKLVKRFFPRPIPHLRAAAVNKNAPLAFRDFLAENTIGEVLVVLGDHAEAASDNPSVCTTLDLIKKIKREAPQIKVYAGIDQYRGSFEQEYVYIQQKIDAGAEGFFTQPFFDFRSLEFYSRKLKGIEIFWGASPVTSLRSKHYWENNNNVQFPPDFVPDLSSSRSFARKVLEFITANGGSVYFMPIKTDPSEYLSGII